ncbi:hypothetical protein L2E82_28363 [Cichorium intybus]|uniref:Uncharacterized protein n=1 Tax=Cichorium intybus TaxID=13427 RepID=A0ACB9CVK8_CICIN|nr:hypothetical protein L2E82_28363 [Cichorium intybus]
MVTVSNAYRDAPSPPAPCMPRFSVIPLALHLSPPPPLSLSLTSVMDLKSCMTTVFILFLLLAVPGFSKEGLGSEVYDIDYRGPETHSHRTPPNRPGGNSNGVRNGNFKKHPQSKRQTAQKRHKEGQTAENVTSTINITTDFKHNLDDVYDLDMDEIMCTTKTPTPVTRRSRTPETIDPKTGK